MSTSSDLKLVVKTICSEAANLEKSGSTSQALLLYDQAMTMDSTCLSDDMKKHVLQCYLKMATCDELADDQVIDLLQKCLKYSCNPCEIHNAIAGIYYDSGDMENAIISYQMAISLNSFDVSNYNLLALIHCEMFNYEQALECYKEALIIVPSHLPTYINLASAYISLGIISEAHWVIVKAIMLFNKLEKTTTFAEREFASGLHNCFETSSKTNLHFKENDSNNIFGKKQPNNIELSSYVDFLPKAYDILGRIYSYCGKHYQCTSAYDIAAMYDLVNDVAWQNKLLSLHYIPEEAGKHHHREAIFNAHIEWGLQFSARHVKLTYYLQNSRSANKQYLNIGYMSSDFNNHSVSFFSEVLISHANHNRFKIVCYDTASESDATTRRLQAHPKIIWRTKLKTKHSRISSFDIAKMVMADEIDILVDLNGHTDGNKMQVFAHKPAPIQVTFIGYPDTTGLPDMDYRFTDYICDPLKHHADDYASENLYRLPNCFLCYTPPNSLPDVGSLPALANGTITFGSFNVFWKVNHRVIQVWSKILLAVPNSKLLLKANSFRDRVITSETNCKFAMYGVASDRLCLLTHTKNSYDHLCTYNKVDISLDTFPYTGTTTTCESLIMGVPVVTLTGKSHMHNVSASLLEYVGPLVTDLITSHEAQYISKAVELAQNLDKLSCLRQSLRSTMQASILCDKSNYMKHVENAYENMWKRSCENAI